MAGWSLLGRRLAEFEVEIDGRKRRCSFALVSKVRNYGGDFTIARSVTLLDDRFEVVLFEGRSSLRYVKYFAGLALNRLAGMKGVTVLRASRVVARRRTTAACTSRSTANTPAICPRRSASCRTP